MKEDEIIRACDRNSNETVTLRKHVTKYKYVRKWMAEIVVMALKLLELTQSASPILQISVLS